ncbi:MAG: DUF5946 family protein [Gammaproteobacteria bacterium]
MKETSCVGCGASFPDIEGPVHRYLDSSPGCWAAFGEVLACEYSDVRYAGVHRLTVDAYAVQHPGRPSPQTIQSVAVHLISLCLVLEHGVEMSRATKAMQVAVKGKDRFFWLTPPSGRFEITVADVRKANTPEEHAELVRAWAACAWSAWSEYHGIVRSWLPPAEQFSRAQQDSPTDASIVAH